jgi:serine/threonine protein phosphatase 1
MREFFVIGDIHGNLDMLEKLLTRWNPDTQLLIFTGDYVDRGPKSRQVIQQVLHLVRNYGAVCIGGNHESFFLRWLNNAEDKLFLEWTYDESTSSRDELAWESMSIQYYSGQGDKTIASFYDGITAYKYLPSVNAAYIKDNFHEEIKFLRELPDYYEEGNYVFAHAGVDLTIDNWRDSGKKVFRDIRHDFHYGQNNTGKIIVFGHEKTKYLHNDMSNNNVWVSPCTTKIGIDGGACSKGLLHGLVINESGMYVHSVDQTGFIRSNAVENSS